MKKGDSSVSIGQQKADNAEIDRGAAALSALQKKSKKPASSFKSSASSPTLAAPSLTTSESLPSPESHDGPSLDDVPSSNTANNPSLLPVPTPKPQKLEPLHHLPTSSLRSVESDLTLELVPKVDILQSPLQDERQLQQQQQPPIAAPDDPPSGLLLPKSAPPSRRSSAHLLTKDRGRWGQLRSLKNLRRVDVVSVASTSIRLSWDPTPAEASSATSSYRISMQEVGATGFLPVVDDTKLPLTTYCGIDLKPDTVYRFHVASLAETDPTSKYGGTKMLIPKSGVKSPPIRTAPMLYEKAWFMEHENEVTREWRSYTGSFKMDAAEDTFEALLTKWVEVEHTEERCYSGIRCMRLKYGGDGIYGGTCVDCELKDDRLYVIRARVYHEWHEETYEVVAKALLRPEDPEYYEAQELVEKDPATDELKKVVTVELVFPKPEEPKLADLAAASASSRSERSAARRPNTAGRARGANLAQLALPDPSQPPPPKIVTTKTYHKTVPPKVFARLGVWDKKEGREWSPLQTADEVPLNAWHTLETKIIGSETGRGKIFVHVEDGYKGSVFVDDVEIIWGGPTEIEKAVDRVIEACETSKSKVQDVEGQMRITLLDARDLAAVDWGGSSDPYATLFISQGDANSTQETQIGKSSVVFSDLFPVWNMDPILVKRPPPPLEVTAIEAAEQATAAVDDKEFQDTKNHAILAEKQKFKDLRREGMSVKEATRLAAKEREDIMKFYLSAAGAAEARADKKDPHKFSLRIELNDFDTLGSPDFLGNCVITKRQIFECGNRCHKMYFPVSGMVGEGKEKRPATGKVSIMVRLHRWNDDNTLYGGCVKKLMTGDSATRDQTMRFLMQTLTLEDVPIEEKLQMLHDILQEPLIEELVCNISDPRRCEAACLALIGFLGDRNSQKKHWGFILRRALQRRLAESGAADAAAELILSWDNGPGSFARKAACLELIVNSIEDQKDLSCSLMKMNPKIIISAVAALELVQKEQDLESAMGSDLEEEQRARIGVAARKVLAEIQYEDNLDEEILKTLWRVRRYIPLESGLWRSPALANMGKSVEDMPNDDEVVELNDVKRMRRAGAWKKALLQPSFWLGVLIRLSAPILPLFLIGVGGHYYEKYCAEDLAGLMIGDGVLLLFTVVVGYAFEFTIRVLEWGKAAFVFTTAVFILGSIHSAVWLFGWWAISKSYPARDFTWTFTSWDERHSDGLAMWGERTLAPTPAGTYNGVGCQTELITVFWIIQTTLGVVGIAWICMLIKLMTYVPKIGNEDFDPNRAPGSSKVGKKITSKNVNFISGGGKTSVKVGVNAEAEKQTPLAIIATAEKGGEAEVLQVGVEKAAGEAVAKENGGDDEKPETLQERGEIEMGDSPAPDGVFGDVEQGREVAEGGGGDVQADKEDRNSSRTTALGGLIALDGVDAPAPLNEIVVVNSN